MNAQTTPGPIFNRELSWLAFNERVLEEALDPSTPLLERLRFLTIFHTNLDEFFMVRISGIKQQISTRVDVLSTDGLSPRAQLSMLHEALRPVLKRADKCLHRDVLPALEDHGIHLVNYRDLSKKRQKEWDKWFKRHVFPILTPLAVAPTHPFPFISNLSLNIALFVSSPEGERRLARVKVPVHNVPRFIPISGSTELEPPVRLLPLEQLIAANLHMLFPGLSIEDSWVFRVTRDADIEIAEDEADDLLEVIQEGIRRRRFGCAVRLEIEADAPQDLRDALRNGLDLDPVDVFDVDGLLGTPDLSELIRADLPELKHPPFVPKRVIQGEDIFAAIRTEDILLHHPFDTISPVVELIRQASVDPDVVAIKQTLYRTNGNSPIIHALEAAVANGKQVAVVVELKARFDEENNIEWARRLEEAGVHVIYGVPGLKTHSKLALVVRRSETGELVRYAHIGTGNYNTITARIYTDLGLLTCDEAITDDVLSLFNHLTGFAQPAEYKRLLVAPNHMKHVLIERIEREAEHARSGKPGRILAKCNAIVDRDVIDALYAASQAGVQIDLLVRGICCLYPGREGFSENIRVRSVVGRFLEHSRLYWFDNQGQPEAYIGSADLMDRNLERRVETLVPILDEGLKSWLKDVFIVRYLEDVQRSRRMLPDGSYIRLREDSAEGPDVHQQFLDDPSR